MKNPTYIKEPTPLQCGQAVLAMLCQVNVSEIVNLLNNERETTLKEMFYTLDYYKIEYDKQRKEVGHKAELPKIAILSLETPRCWHWSLYFDGVFYDPEHGILNDFPKSRRKYFWEIKENIC
ncbi:MAG: hypothetical protein E7537_00705 [Ruminococcaceae bacterium]|nr:hypothetical protein [Oscillospiraceae bacterium]